MSNQENDKLRDYVQDNLGKYLADFWADEKGYRCISDYLWEITIDNKAKSGNEHTLGLLIKKALFDSNEVSEAIYDFGCSYEGLDG